MSDRYGSGVELTLGGLHKALRALEDRVEDLANGKEPYPKIEGNTDGAVLSDKQMEKIDERIGEQIRLYVGDKSIRLNLWALGSFSLGSAITFLLNYFFGHKG